MAIRQWGVVHVVGLLVLACQLHCHDARKLGHFIQYRSSLVLHFQPHLHFFARRGDYSGLEINTAYTDSHEKEEATEDSEEEEGDDKQHEEEEGVNEPHPADELLQTHNADGTKSYILGGY